MRFPPAPDISDLRQPVRCNRCHTGVYDLGTVEVTARYADCSVWTTPCCRSVVDDRGHTGWTSRKDYEHITGGLPAVDIYGKPALWKVHRG